MRTTNIAVLASLLVAGVTIPAAAAGAPALGPAEIAAMQQRGETFVLADVRSLQHYEMKHARGALSIPAFAIADKPLPRAQRIVVYDAGAGSTEAAKAAAALVLKGFPNVFVMDGGLTAWEAADLPIVAPPGLSGVPFVEPISAEALRSLLDGGARVVLIDLRPPPQFHAGHLPGAMSLSEQKPPAPTTELVVVYDDGKGTAREHAEQLRRQGYRAVKYLFGGAPAWRHPLEPMAESREGQRQ